MSPASPLSRSITKMQGEKGMRGEGAGVDARLRYPAISELTPCSPTPLFHAPPPLPRLHFFSTWLLRRGGNYFFHRYI